MNLHDFVHGIDPTIKLVIEDEFPGKRCVGGKYVPGAHSIFLYEKDVKIQCRRLFGSNKCLESYRWIILAHELGHALDEDLLSLSEEFNQTEDMWLLYQIERNAWDIGEKLIPFIDSELFAYIKDESLAHYYKQIGKIS
ncbi:hypothetical protein ACLHDF_08660 [Priestia aryabhattai]|uniref:hypothetical protein n=1 Tax=Priestia megaterium TaxID=1404 RepID=UPI0039B95008